MDNNYYNQTNTYYHKKSGRGIEIAVFAIGICALLMSVIGSMFTMKCSAGKTFDLEEGIKAATKNYKVIEKSLETLDADKIYDSVSEVFKYRTSPIMALPLCGGIMGAGCMIWSVILYKKNKGKTAMVSVVIGLAAAILGILPASTVCIHNCNLNRQDKNIIEDLAGTANTILR